MNTNMTGLRMFSKIKNICILMLLTKLGSALKGLTLKLLVANLANAKRGKRPENLLKPWHMGTHLRELSESYLMNINMTGFQWFSKILASLCFGQK